MKQHLIQEFKIELKRRVVQRISGKMNKNKSNFNVDNLMESETFKTNECVRFESK